VSGRAVRVELDQAHDFLDVDRSDNVWTSDVALTGE
jgi:hypothetical protein